jgi:hypothetical protein
VRLTSSERYERDLPLYEAWARDDAVDVAYEEEDFTAEALYEDSRREWPDN